MLTGILLVLLAACIPAAKRIEDAYVKRLDDAYSLITKPETDK